MNQQPTQDEFQKYYDSLKGISHQLRRSHHRKILNANPTTAAFEPSKQPGKQSRHPQA